MQSLRSAVICVIARDRPAISVIRAAAFPTYVPASQVSGAVRSPCPGLNALANHGFLPRNGRNISLPVVQQAILSTFRSLRLMHI
jgi:hypothetical protein